MEQESKILHQILTDHLTRYPAMQVQDLYKLLQQAALGSEHAIRNKEAAWKWLEREMAEMGAGPDDPLFDPLSPDGEIARIHLRPYLRAGKEPQTLLAAFLRTANEWRGSVETLRVYGQAAAHLAETETWQIRRLEIENFFAKMEEEFFPAVHHSSIYVEHYHPAYRVVNRNFLEVV
jgi:hypothetical protein